MDKVTPSHPNERGIQDPSGVNSDATHQDRPLELVGTREGDGRSIRAEFERILPRCFHRRERPSVFGFNFLNPVLVLEVIYIRVESL